MSKKKPTKKGSSKSNKENAKKEEKVDLSEYEESYDGEDKAQKEDINLDEYELPEDFVPEDYVEVSEDELNWIQKQTMKLKELDNYQRLYWIKILLGSFTGILIGLFGAQTGWWLLLMLGIYAAVTAGGYFLFKLEWNFKEVIFSGFFPYLALFTLTWVLMFSSLYAPPIAVWFDALKTTITEVVNGTEVIYTSTRTTSAAGFPIYAILLSIAGAIGLLQFLLRIQKRREERS